MNQVSKSDFKNKDGVGLGLFALGQSIERCFPDVEEPIVEVHVVKNAVGGKVIGIFKNLDDAKRVDAISIDTSIKTYAVQ
jgi:hypothetical protein